MANQGTGLPEKAPEKINGIRKLTMKTEFDTWLYLVKDVLRPVDCADLIDSNIPRPTSTDQDAYNRWRKMSLCIRSWITAQLDVEIIKELRQLPNKQIYADEYIDAIRTIVIGERYIERQTVWKAAVRTYRHQYGSIEQFVVAYCDVWQRANNLNVSITPWCAAVLLLGELENELPNWTMAQYCSWPKDKSTTMTKSEFQHLCREAIDIGKKRERELKTRKLKRRAKARARDARVPGKGSDLKMEGEKLSS
ncbi:hypothetical protein DTO212C5_7832 [Paecilomyces variotii]|nr:hypothetical protein DTO212C5_7832 [Paecilomyces variotii]